MAERCKQFDVSSRGPWLSFLLYLTLLSHGLSCVALSFVSFQKWAYILYWQHEHNQVILFYYIHSWYINIEYREQKSKWVSLGCSNWVFNFLKSSIRYLWTRCKTPYKVKLKVDFINERESKSVVPTSLYSLAGTSEGQHKFSVHRKRV